MGNFTEVPSIGTVACEGDVCVVVVDKRVSITIQRRVVSSPLPERSCTTVKTARGRDTDFERKP